MTYKGNDNRIVRIKDDTIHTMIDIVACECGMPYQEIFEIWCELIILEAELPDLQQLWNTAKYVKARYSS